MNNYFRNLLTAQAHSLLLPRSQKADIERYVAMHSLGGTGVTRERAPFQRQLDFWVFSIAAALARGLTPLQVDPPSKWGEKFVDTRSVEMSEDICAVLAIVSVARLGHQHPEVDVPRRIIDLGNRLAAVGCPIVLESLSADVLRKPALDRAMDLARDLYHQVRAH